MAEHILDREIKILVPVRDLVDILASFEKLFRSQSHEWQFPQEKSNHAQWQTCNGRAEIWMRDNQPVGAAYNRIRDAIDRGFADRLHFIELEGLTNFPEVTMKQVYKFLGEKWFEHDFNNVEQVTHENDDMHGIPGLHTIRPKVAPVQVDAQSLIGDLAYNKFKDAQFWRQ